MAAIPFNIFGPLSGQQQDAAEARAERTNANFYEKQASFSKQAMRRELNIFDRESRMFEGSQVNAFSRAGVDMSGSVLAIIGQTRQQALEERQAIKQDYQFRAKVSKMRASQSEDRAKQLSDPGQGIMRGFGRLFGG